jgi:hypothetical protein
MAEARNGPSTPGEERGSLRPTTAIAAQTAPEPATTPVSRSLARPSRRHRTRRLDTEVEMERMARAAKDAP